MKPLCIAPFIGFNWRGNQSEDTENIGRYFTCCEAIERFGVDFKKGSTFDEVFNNDHAKKVRQELLEGRWPVQCEGCKNVLEKTGFDQRETYNNLVQEADWNVEEGNGIKWIDIRPSNLCNLKCRMCSPVNSNLIASEQKELGVQIHKRYLFKKSENNFVDSIPFEDVQLVKILGGEPLVQKETKDILNRVPNDCLVNITTNGYKPHADILQAVLDSKAKVRLNISIDGIGKEYEYVRSGSKWSEVEKFVHSIPKEKINSISCVPSLWNAFSLKDWFLWTEQFEVRRFFHFTFQPWLSLSLLDDEDKLDLMDMMKDFKYFDHLKTHFLQPTKNREELLKRFTIETRHLDKVRGTNILDLDPRFEKYLYD